MSLLREPPGSVAFAALQGASPGALVFLNSNLSFSAHSNSGIKMNEYAMKIETPYGLQFGNALNVPEAGTPFPDGGILYTLNGKLMYHGPHGTLTRLADP